MLSGHGGVEQAGSTYNRDRRRRSTVNQPFTIWLMRGFLVDVPHELYEAAEIDGRNAWQVFSRVALPVVRPGAEAGIS